MGYDMYWVTKDPGEAEGVARARVVWDAAVAARNALPDGEKGRHTREEFDHGSLMDAPANATDRYRAAQAAVKRASADVDAARRSYFRLNGRGMGRAREVMDRLGLLCDPPQPELPDNPEDDEAYDWVAYPEYREGAPPDAARLAVAERYVTERRAILAAHQGECPGIPVYKLCSNDGWIVTPAECRTAHVMWEAAKAADPELAPMVAKQAEWFGEWMAWIAAAADHDGFEVH